MTSALDALPAGSNGHQPSQPTEQKEQKEHSERKTGLAYVRESEAVQLAKLATDAFYEAERLVHEVHRQAFDVHIVHDPDAGSGVDVDRAYEAIGEALTLSETGEHYLRMLLDVVRGIGSYPITEPLAKRQPFA